MKTITEDSDLVAAGNGLMQALLSVQTQIGCGCGDYGPCRRCTAATAAAVAATEAWEEAKKDVETRAEENHE